MTKNNIALAIAWACLLGGSITAVRGNMPAKKQPHTLEVLVGTQCTRGKVVLASYAEEDEPAFDGCKEIERHTVEVLP